MYKCQQCGNREYFKEYNCVETQISINKETGVISQSNDRFVERENVECGICGATLEDGKVLEVQQ